MGDNPNPAWKSILDVLPESLHPVVMPVLKEWDQGVQQRFQEIHNQYTELEPYKAFVKNNIDPAYVEQAVILADQLQRDPKNVVNNMIQTWDLDFVSKDEAAKLAPSSSQNSGDEDEDFSFGNNEDILNHPLFKQMKDTLDQLQGNYEQDKQSQAEQQAIAEFENYLNDLEKSYTDPERDGGPLPFNRTFVTALMSQGLSGEDAVKQYHETLAIASSPDNTSNTQQQAGNEQPPVVMGSQGTVGSGQQDLSFKPGELSRSELNANVEALLKASLENGN